jgi:hypothetical protein
LGRRIFSSKLLFLLDILWLRGQDLNLRPLGYERNDEASSPIILIGLVRFYSVLSRT